MEFLLVNFGTTGTKARKIIRHLVIALIALLFLPLTIFGQGEKLSVTDFVLFGGSGGVYIGSSNTINDGLVGSNFLVQSTGNALINSSIHSQGSIYLAMATK